MNFAKWVSFSLVIILIYIIWQVKQLLLLALTAVVIAISLNILVVQIRRFGVKRKYAVGVAIFSLLAVIFLFGSLVVPSLVTQFEELSKLVPKGIDKLILELNNLRDSLSLDVVNALPNLDQILAQLRPILNELVSRGFTIVSGFLGLLLSSLLLLALSLMILVDPLPYRSGFIRLFPQFYRSRMDKILVYCERDLQEWLTDTLIRIFSAIILSSFVLFIFGIPLVSVQSLLAGFLVLIPYIGPSISVISPVAIAFITSSWKPWFILLFYIIIYQVIEYAILPKIRKNRVILSPANIIIGEVFFGSLLGVLGLFLALPLTIISQIIVKEILVKDILDKIHSKTEN
ncbi:AI-2E family transporter [Cyanobacterium stanieri LEGE 03274]|uniref:AI-2E family transporter n=1 Tax=Cyanobacterium stanieri LEGE 03274 TaxID=1828756 RepID=A0ABR9V1T1_9CHRO|nr:AI-2E family transporter [Cyanobacterium stanieri]MBE9221845.1 AI-2E family transporter [Cyanobacterium stanieri LEGE 03274]